MTSIPSILHLRQAEGAGGGADRVLADEVSQAVKSREVRTAVAYLLHKSRALGGIAERYLDLDVRYEEIPGRRLLDLRQLQRIGKILEEEHVDLIHCHDPKSDVFGYLLGRRYPDVILVSTIHGWTNTSYRSRIYKWLDIRALRCFDRVIAVSQPLALEARTAGICRTICIENGIDTDFWRRSRATRLDLSTGDSPHIGFVGRLSGEKDPETLIRTFALIADRIPTARFSIAGDGPEREQIGSLARRFKIEHRLEMLGWLQPDRLRQLYLDLDVFLLASRTEGSPLVVLEAMAMQVPVVATAVGGVDRIVRDRLTGLTAREGDAEGLADAVCSLARNSEMARVFAASARQLVIERHSVSATWSRRLACYRSEIQERQGVVGSSGRSH